MDKKKLKFRLGIVLISVSVAFFLIIFAMPFIPMNLKVKVALTTTLVVVGEVSFWVGTLLIGKEVYKKFMAYLKSGEWLEKKKEDVDKNETEL
ncbi:MAG TPA: transporter suffix domain-containing protein [Prolixibacteraceae bacterium]|nr:transporter suffix domain-containing protein [Prolixibacteraceae bacterium]